MASVGFKKRKNIGAAKQRTGITSTKAKQEIGEHAEAGIDDNEDDAVDVDDDADNKTDQCCYLPPLGGAGKDCRA